MNSEVSHSDNDLRKLELISISPELFEKLYLSPENAVKGDLRKTFGNPTLIYVILLTRSRNKLTSRRALVGFVVALSPLSVELMGWRGATGLSATVYVALSYLLKNQMLMFLAEEQTTSLAVSFWSCLHSWSSS